MQPSEGEGGREEGEGDKERGRGREQTGKPNIPHENSSLTLLPLSLPPLSRSSGNITPDTLVQLYNSLHSLDPPPFLNTSIEAAVFFFSKKPGVPATFEMLKQIVSLNCCHHVQCALQFS